MDNSTFAWYNERRTQTLRRTFMNDYQVIVVGEGAGIAAAIAVNDGVSVQDVSQDKLRRAIDSRDLVEGY